MQEDYLDKVFLLLYVGAEIFHDDLNKKKRSHLCTQMDVHCVSAGQCLGSVVASRFGV